jgi:hypothetical protein
LYRPTTSPYPTVLIVITDKYSAVVYVLLGVAVQVEFLLKQRVETSFSLDRIEGLKPGAFKREGSTGFALYGPHLGFVAKISPSAGGSSHAP